MSITNPTFVFMFILSMSCNDLQGATGYDVSTSSILSSTTCNEAGEECHPAVLTEMQKQTVGNRVDVDDDTMKYNIATAFNPVLARHLPHLMAASTT
jgi:hypothetical protein